MPDCYRKLIEKCWSENPLEKPTFETIQKILRDDSNFITEKVDKQEYLNYIKYIQSSSISFDSTKRIRQLDDIISSQIQFFQNNDELVYGKYVTQMHINSIEFISFDLSRFEKVEKIGEGSFGKVYKIINKEDEKYYAAKVSIREENEFNEDLISRLYQEMVLLSKLSHSSILKFIGFNSNNFKGKPKPTIVTEYATNGSLEKVLEMKRNGEEVPEWNDTKRLINIYGIASAMSYIHSNNMIHRDLKPGNILLDEYLFPKIADLGFARFIQSHEIKVKNSSQDKKQIPGSLEYIDPELLCDEIYGYKSDVYSFAIIMYEIMTNDRPYDNLANEAEIMYEIVNKNGRPKFKKPIPDCYYNLIEKCWSQDSDDRPSFDEIVEILKTDQNFITETVNKEEFLTYVDFIDTIIPKSAYNQQKNELEFVVNSKEHAFRKVNIYINKKMKNEIRPMSINVDFIDLKRFQIIKQIGEGSFGTVYTVSEKETCNIYAAKISIYELDQSTEDKITNLEREVNIISELNHPSILKFTGFNIKNFKNKPKPTIITEYVSNGSIDKIFELERMNCGIFEWDDTKKLINIFGIASGMKYLHSLDIIHRDLKPANILIDEFLFPKISDFGLSKKLNNISSQNKSGFKGTYAYSAPEIFRGEYSKAGDVYAFGLIVYEIMTNEILFLKFNQFQLMYQILKGYRPPFKYPIPLSYRKLIELCWSEDPKERPTFDDIVDQLKNDEGFITENVDKEDFLNFVDYVENVNEVKQIPQTNEKSSSLNKQPKTVKINKIKEIDENDDEELVSCKNNFLHLNKFEKGSLISKGDFYKTYIVKSKETKVFYSGKISIFRISNFPRDDLISLSKEVKIISQLNHPSFMKFIGYSPNDFKNQPKPVIVTELPLNGSLKDILDQERKGEEIPSWNETKKLINIYGIASGMSYLHSHNIIHRDLKPCNVFLDDYLFPKIGDFGLSLRYHNIDSMSFQSTSGMKGTPTYSSPEILQFNNYSKSGDVYAFAFIVYEIVSNQIPFKGFDNTIEIYNEVVNKCKRLELNNEIGLCYRELIQKCWSQNENERLSFDEIVDVLKNDQRFITENVCKDDFLDYIEFIEKSKFTFNYAKEVLKIDDFIQSKSRLCERESDNDENSDDENESDCLIKVEET